MTSLLFATAAAAIPAATLCIFNDVPFGCLVEVLCEFTAGCMIYVSFKGLWNRDPVRIIAGVCALAGILIWAGLNIGGIAIGARWTVALFPMLVMFVAISTGIIPRVLALACLCIGVKLPIRYT